MAGEDGVGPEPGGSAGLVDVVREAGGPAVLAVRRDRRVVAGDEDGPLACFALRLQALELARQERELVVRDRVVAVLGRDHARPSVDDVRVEADDRDERRVEREVDARLRHRAADEPAGVRRRARRVRAEVPQEGRQRRDLRQVGGFAEDRSVVVAGDREDRPVVVAERLVELVVVVLPLAEVVDDVAEVEEEGGGVGSALVDVARHRVGHAGLVRDRLLRRLEVVDLRGPRVADAVERDLLRRGDGGGRVAPEHLREIHPRRTRPRRRHRLQLVLVEQVVR